VIDTIFRIKWGDDWYVNDGIGNGNGHRNPMQDSKTCPARTIARIDQNWQALPVIARDIGWRGNIGNSSQVVVDAIMNYHHVTDSECNRNAHRENTE